MNNRQAMLEAQKFFPGGVNSPVRAFKSVDCEPPFIEKGVGSHVFDIEGHDYIDYVGSWGPLILGHADKDVVNAVCKAAEGGLSFGAPTQSETELGRLVQKAFPNMEKMRFVSSGSEATMSAIRLARGYTERPLIVKCEGAYHGHADSLLVSAGSGVATLGIPGCPGIPADIAKNTLTIPYNDSQALEQCFKAHKDKIACFIVEPVCGNMGVVKPKEGYLEKIKAICDANDALLIFDEVMTGFRGCFGGVSEISGVTPDLTCLGKIVGGGMPMAVYGGSEKIMKSIAPDGSVYQAGTLSGNPVAVAAGIATLKKISQPDFYKNLLDKAEHLEKELGLLAEKHGVAAVTNRYGSMMTLFFTDRKVNCYEDAAAADGKKFVAWFKGMLAEGIYLAPSPFESAFVSSVHNDKDISKTLEAADKVLAQIQ